MNTLKSTLQNLYKNDFVVLELLDNLDYTAIKYKYHEELYSRMSYDDCAVAEAMLDSELVKNYQKACEEATLSCTMAISGVLDKVLNEDSDK